MSASPQYITSLLTILWWQVLRALILSFGILVVIQIPPLLLLVYSDFTFSWDVLLICAVLFLWQAASIVVRAVSAGDYASNAPAAIRWAGTLSSRSVLIHVLFQCTLTLLVFLVAGSVPVGRRSGGGPGADTTTTAAAITSLDFFAKFRLTAPCTDAVMAALDTETELYVSADELDAALASARRTTTTTATGGGGGENGDSTIFHVIQSAKLDEIPRCVRGDGAALLLVALAATIYATLRWHAIGFSSAFSLPQRWARDGAASRMYWQEKELPIRDFAARVFQGFRIACREMTIVTVRGVFVVMTGIAIFLPVYERLLLQADAWFHYLFVLPTLLGGAPVSQSSVEFGGGAGAGGTNSAKAVMYNDGGLTLVAGAAAGNSSSSSNITALMMNTIQTDRAASSSSSSSSIEQAWDMFLICFIVAAIHAVHGALLVPVFFTDRVAIEDFLSGFVASPLPPTGPKGGPNAPHKFDLFIAAMRITRPKSLQHYLLGYPANAKAEAIAAAGGGGASHAGISATVPYVFPAWARREPPSTVNGVSMMGNGPQPAITTTTTTTAAGGGGGGVTTITQLQPGVLTLPNLPFSVQRIHPSQAALVRAWQERMECGNWALFADETVAGQHGIARGSDGGAVIETNRSSSSTSGGTSTSGTSSSTSSTAATAATAQAAATVGGIGSPLSILSSMLGITSPERAILQSVWYSSRVIYEENIATGAPVAKDVVLATTSPWLHILRDLILCSAAPSNVITTFEREGLLGETGERVASVPLVTDYVLADVQNDQQQQQQQSSSSTDSSSSNSSSTVDANFTSSKTVFTTSKFKKPSLPISSFPTTSETGDVDDDGGVLTFSQLGGAGKKKTGGSVPQHETNAGGNSGNSFNNLQEDRANGLKQPKAFILSVGPQFQNASDRAPVYTDATYRRWKDLLWSSTALIDSSTIALFAAAASDTFSTSSASSASRPVAVEVTVPVYDNMRRSRVFLGKASGVGGGGGLSSRLGSKAAASTADDDTSSSSSSSSSSPADEDDGDDTTGTKKGSKSATRSKNGLSRALLLMSKSAETLGKAIKVAVYYALFPFLKSITQMMGVTAVYTFCVSVWTRLLFQVRPYEPAEGARLWAEAKLHEDNKSSTQTAVMVRNHKLPLTLDETIGGVAVDTRDADRFTKILLDVLAPNIRPIELDELAATSIRARTFRGALSQPVSTSGASALQQSSLRESYAQQQAAPQEDKSMKRTFFAVVGRGLEMLLSWKQLVAAVTAIGSDFLYAFGGHHVASILRVVWESATVAAGYGFERGAHHKALPVGGGGGGGGNLSASGGASSSSSSSTTAVGAGERTEGASILRRAARGLLTRSPEADTADVLRDVRATCAAAELLVSVVNNALRGEDNYLRQVAPYVPVVAYSLASCLVACATYCSSPRYSATIAWSAPMYWRGSDEDAQAVADVEAVLGYVSRTVGPLSASQGGGSLKGRQIPTLQVNMHVPGSSGGSSSSAASTAVEFVPRSERPALATLQVVLLRCLVALHTAPQVKGIDSYMNSVAEEAPSLPIRAVLMLAGRKAKVNTL